MKKPAGIVFSVWILLCIARIGMCLDANDMIRLKKGGFSDETIRIIKEEKIIETCAFTIQEILNLKLAGLSETTIQALVKEGSFMKSAGTVVYGNDVRSIRQLRTKDIVELKASGISDEIIRTLIIFGPGALNERDRESAWQLLKNMAIIIDKQE